MRALTAGKEAALCHRSTGASPSAARGLCRGALLLRLDEAAQHRGLCTTYPAVGEDGQLVPDWAAVARDWDAVHLTLGGALTAEQVRVEGPKGWTELAGWDAELTAWLRWRFDDVDVSQTCLNPRNRRLQWARRRGSEWAHHTYAAPRFWSALCRGAGCDTESLEWGATQLKENFDAPSSPRPCLPAGAAPGPAPSSALALAREQETGTPAAGWTGTPGPVAGPTAGGTPAIATPAALGTRDATPATPVTGCEEAGIPAGITIRIVDFAFEPAQTK